jgi:hypothetical protein
MSRDRDTFGARDFPLGTFRAAVDKWAENDTERREVGRVADIMDRHLAKRLNFGAPSPIGSSLKFKKAKPPKAGGKRRRWKKDRAVIANLRRVFKHSVDELRGLTENAIAFNFGRPTQQAT